ncbi:MAG: hypothetical protein JXC32_03730, partial [Anaerolineae bacterium]|nr:hypothetical protein [Anaerolineae bacterium]
MIAILVLLACASRQPVRVSDPVLAAPDAQQAAYRNVCALLTRRQLRQYDFLDDWTADHLLRLEVWLRGGIRFEGPWTSQELSDILQVLDAFGSAFGSARFVELLDTAVDARTGGREHHLRLVHEPGFTPPAAGWYARSGRIVLTDGLWSAEYVALHHTWSFLTGPYVSAGSATANRHVVVGHELGHVIVDGLRIEALAQQEPGLCIEGLYSEVVPKAQWPHFDAGTNEHLATEIAVWALG